MIYLAWLLGVAGALWFLRSVLKDDDCPDCGHLGALHEGKGCITCGCGAARA